MNTDINNNKLNIDILDMTNINVLKDIFNKHFDE